MIDLSQFDVSSPVSYLVAVIVRALDTILPMLPSDTAAVALGGRRVRCAQTCVGGRALDRFGTRIIIVCRFIPTRPYGSHPDLRADSLKRRSFIIATACAGVISP